MMRLFLISLGFIIFATTAFAQKYDSSHRDWSVYTHRGTCYVGSAPVQQAGNYSRRGQPYLLVVYRSKDLSEINVSSGYPYKDKSEVKASVDSNRFKLFTEGETAWAFDSNQDRKMVNAMKKGNKITVRGTSQVGTWSEDTYSLMGFSAALKRMAALCK